MRSPHGSGSIRCGELAQGSMARFLHKFRASRMLVQQQRRFGISCALTKFAAKFMSKDGLWRIRPRAPGSSGVDPSKSCSVLTLLPVKDLDAPALAPYRTMRAQFDHFHQGIFVAEGEKVVRRLLQSGLEIL